MKTVAHTQPAIASPKSTTTGGSVDTSIGIFILTFPIAVIASVLLYKRYRVVQKRRQREILERIWKLNHQEKTI
ncbi:hypothetical protein K9N68_34570 (plasmid) [Kovacikia minuta CCNUW1]|uniref:hypothetical protein n=1 Tax=Kovacikia minuta TaxID=2931930 RepID=UPI001CCC11EA|nr:hypothetical protein [Kovacikia minuta]UBF30336.1 hypothetical protein K9N68_34570 [Kovacikia minuta CCNUW1]